MDYSAFFFEEWVCLSPILCSTRVLSFRIVYFRSMIRLISYNVNGIRSALNKGLKEWLAEAGPEILCLQEIKAEPGQLDERMFHEMGYETYWFPAKKKGYSGTAIFTKIPPKQVEFGCGIEEYDYEGRVIRADFEGFSVMSVYFPSGTTGEERQNVKYRFMDDFRRYVDLLRKSIPNLIIMGDVNICHLPIDIHDPVSNKNSTGFLPEERAWLDGFIKSGMVDTFREFYKEPHQYSWWSFRAASRERNKGWRIDYALASEPLRPYLKNAGLMPEAKHSDHCPVMLELDFSYL
jgi:exodeoxyribonuclease-3